MKVFIDTSELKRNKNGIIWDGNNGEKIKFEYGEICGFFQIESYFKSVRKVLIRSSICNDLFLISPAHLINGKIKRILSPEFTFYNFKKNDTLNKGKIKVLSRLTIKSVRYYLVEDEDIVYKISQRGLIESLRVPKPDFVSIYESHTHLVDYFVDIRDAKKYSHGSNELVEMKCPFCGFKKSKTVNKLTSQGFACPVCSDGISYPNKFIANFLKSQNIDFCSEVIFDWCKNKRYDFYLPKHNIIIEAHGKQHYSDPSGYMANIEDQKQNDINKRLLAIEFSDADYYEIDCYYSNADWISNSIIKSGLLEKINIDEKVANWAEIDKCCMYSKIEEVCNLWNSEPLCVGDIAKKTNVSTSTVRNYLLKGVSLGVCDYSRPESKRRSFKKRKTPIKKIKLPKVRCVELNLTFSSFTECAIELEKIFNDKFNQSHISACCRGMRKTHKNFHFENV